ncbi:hypothetical protein D3C87_1683010 [compost metagenome]
MAECETELKFYLSGLVSGTERAMVSIKALNLGHTLESNRGLVGARKQMVDMLMFDLSTDAADLQFEDEELLRMFLEDLKTPKATQCLQPFSPVLVNVIQHFLTQP